MFVWPRGCPVYTGHECGRFKMFLLKGQAFGSLLSVMFSVPNPSSSYCKRKVHQTK